jgi:Holliday junction DNA helicase RuvB
MSILHGEPLVDDIEDKDATLRPVALDDFIGQADIKKNLQVFIQAAKKRQETLDHVFVSGPPGLGKTTLSSIIAHEMGTDLVTTSAPALEKPKDLVGMLSTLQPHSIFFIDEIHRLKPVIEEMLYIAMEDFELDFVIGQGASARTIKVPIPPFTLIGATTKPGRVSSPLYTRFGITIRINLYPIDDLKHIITRSASLLKVNIDSEAAYLLASCSRGTPRVANRLLRRLRDFAQIDHDNHITTSITQQSLQRLGIDFLGLEEQDRQILLCLINHKHPIGVETLAISVGESADTLEDFYEPYLIQCGFLQRTARGRTVTAKAYAHMGIPYDTAVQTSSQELFD